MMSEKEIRCGQVWRETSGKQRTGRVAWFSMGCENLRLSITAPNKPGVRPWTDISFARLFSEWELVTEAA